MAECTWVRIFVPLMALTVGTGCGLVPTENCTSIFMPGIVVRVTDSLTGRPVSQATFVAMRAGTNDSLETNMFSDTAALTFTTAYELPGVYSLRVVSSGYRDWTRDGVRVSAGACHVRQEELDARLLRIIG
jgi:hypothetical protein